jgi:hypothetical protein
MATLVSGDFIKSYRSPDFVFKTIEDKSGIKLLPLEKSIKSKSSTPDLVKGRKVVISYAPKPKFGNIPVPDLSRNSLINMTDTGTM